MRVGILDYGFGGNIYSIAKSIDKLGYSVEVVKKLNNIDKLIIPGVGSYNDASKIILEYKEEIKEFSKNKHILGICLGMQLLTNRGFEFGEHEGLGIIDGECVKINTHKPLPHIGWNNIETIRDSKLLKNIEHKNFYFMHSYEVINYEHCVGLTDYEGHKFVSVIEKDNVFGVQFHPEKSREDGLQLFENFLRI